MPSDSKGIVALVLGKEGYLTVFNTEQGYNYTLYEIGLSELKTEHLDEPGLTIENLGKTIRRMLGGLPETGEVPVQEIPLRL